MTTETKDKTKDAITTVQPKVYDYGEDVGAGFQNQTKDDIAIPFIDILQPGSPEILAPTNTGAIRAGMIINRVTGEVFDGAKGISMIPALTEHCYTEWKPRKGPNGETLKGGFVARHELTEDVCQQARRDAPFKLFRMPNGNDLAETFYVYGMQVLDDGASQPVAIPFGSTKIRGYKNWSYIMNAIQVLAPGNRRVTPPMFAHKYRVTTKMVEKDGNRWFVFVIGFDGKDAESCRLEPTDELYLNARGVMTSVGSGALKVDYSKTDEAGVHPSKGEDGGKAPF